MSVLLSHLQKMSHLWASCCPGGLAGAAARPASGTGWVQAPLPSLSFAVSSSTGYGIHISLSCRPANQLPVMTSTPSSGRVCCHERCDFLSLQKSTVRQRWSQTPILHAGSSLEAWRVTCEASSSRVWGPAASGGQRRKTAPRYMPCSITTALCWLPTQCLSAPGAYAPCMKNSLSKVP